MKKVFEILVAVAVVVVVVFVGLPACQQFVAGMGENVPHQCDMAGTVMEDGRVYPAQVAVVTRYVVERGVYVAPYEIETCGATFPQLSNWLGGMFDSFEVSPVRDMYPRGTKVEIVEAVTGGLGVSVKGEILYPSWDQSNPPKVSP